MVGVKKTFFFQFFTFVLGTQKKEFLEGKQRVFHFFVVGNPDIGLSESKKQIFQFSNFVFREPETGFSGSNKFSLVSF